MILWREASWWLWAINAALLIAGLSGWSAGTWPALAFAMAQVVIFRLREGRFGAFRVQVRIGYVAILAAGMWPPLLWLDWLLAAGTCVQVLLGYCLLARTLSLLPWNRLGPLTTGLVWRTFASRPVRGSILQGLPPLR